VPHGTAPPTPPYKRVTYTAVRQIKSKPAQCAPSTEASSITEPAAVHPIKAECPTDALPPLPDHRLPLSFNPLAENRSGLRSCDLLCPLQTSACRSARLAPRSVCVGQLTSANNRQTSQGKTRYFPCVDARLIKHTPCADGGLRCHVPTRPGCTTPTIGFLFVAPHLWIGLPSDPTSR